MKVYITNDLLSTLKRRMIINNNFLQHSVLRVVQRLTGKYFSNNKLKNAASRIVVPQPFLPFVHSIEQVLEGFKFPENLKFTVSEVKEAHAEILENFSRPNFDCKSLNYDLLITAGHVAAEDCGLVYGYKHPIMDFASSAESFESGTSSGFPLYHKKGTDTARRDAIEWCENFRVRPELTNILSQATSVFNRFQYKVDLNTNNVTKKIRPVWGESFRVQTLEGYFFRDIIESIAEFQVSSSFPRVATGLTNFQISERIIKHLRTSNSSIYSIDVKQFDSYVPSFMWSLFYSIMEDYVTIETESDKLMFKSLFAFHNYTPYCYMGTNLRFQYKGVPSGSLITSFMDSWVSRTIVNYAFLESSGITAEDKSCVLGDDNIVVGSHFSMEYLIDVYKRFGLIVSVEKSVKTTSDGEISFLGRVWDIENRPTEPLAWYVAHYALPTRYYTDIPFSVSQLHTYRCITMSMSLYKGMDMFEKLLGWSDIVWIEMKRQYYQSSMDPIIYMVSEDMRTLYTRIPMSSILRNDWTQF